MKIAICASLDFIPEIKTAGDALKQLGHEVFLPQTAEAVIRGELSYDTFLEDQKDEQKRLERKVKINAIVEHYEKIKASDAILVLNQTKKSIENYIGGNTFLEIGFAHVLHKKVFLQNPVPQMLYTDELLAMQPQVIGKDYSKII